MTVYKFNTIEEAIEDIQRGKMVVVVDDEDRENEGDLLMAADMINGQSINFMARYGRGLICMPAQNEILNRLCISQMVKENTDNHCTAFSVSIDYINTTTGISAYERAETIKKVLDKDSKPQSFRRPGHVFPLEGKEGGVLERAGHTEAAIDLAKLSGFQGAGVICEIMNEDGTMARTSELMEFVKEHDLKIITIESLITYRLNKENIAIREAEANLPTKYGDFKIVGYKNRLNGEEHIALVKGELDKGVPVLVRIHSECFTGDVLGSCKCDCGNQLTYALKKIQEEGRGVLLYMKQEGRGIGLINKIKAYKLQEEGLDTVEANIALGFPEDLRDYTMAAHILKNLGVEEIKLMTNNPKKIEGLQKNFIKVVERVSIQTNFTKESKFYMKTKKLKMGHLININ